jgi:hypothetical protein
LVLKIDLKLRALPGVVDAIANLNSNGILCGGAANDGRERQEGSSETHYEQLG